MLQSCQEDGLVPIVTCKLHSESQGLVAATKVVPLGILQFHLTNLGEFPCDGNDILSAVIELKN